jgi:hypothetical protein
MRHIFIASVSYGKPNLTKFRVEKETEKLFILGEKTSILGTRSWARQIHKNDVTCFENHIDAVDYLITEQNEYIERTQEKLKEASGSLVTLKSLKAELERE